MYEIIITNNTIVHQLMLSHELKMLEHIGII